MFWFANMRFGCMSTLSTHIAQIVRKLNDD